MSLRRGFTLVEMLVVLGILAVLFAILTPVFLRVRAGARTAVCVTHLKQLCVAARMYSDDYDRTVVPARTSVPLNGTRGITWCVLLQPYIKDRGILTCPGDPTPTATADSVCLPHSYGINYLLAYNSTWGGAQFTTCLSHVKRVSELVLFFELKSSTQTMGASYYANRLSRVDWRHNGLGNFGFLDGHVKGLRATAVDTPLVWDPFAG